MTNLVELAIPRPALPTAQIVVLAEFAQEFEVVDQMSADVAAAEYSDVRARIATLDAERMKIKRPLLDAGKAVDALFKLPLEEYQRIGTILADKLAAFEDRKQREQEENARKQREQEREQRERIAREAAEFEQRARANAARLRAEAEKQAADGNQTAAAEFQQRADAAELAGQQDAQLKLIEMPEGPAPEAPAKTQGITVKQEWEWIGADLMATVQAVAAGQAPLSVLRYDMVAIQRQVDGLKGEFKVPGITVRPRTAIAAKARR